MDLKKEILAVVLAAIIVLSGVAWAAAIAPQAAATGAMPTTLSITAPSHDFATFAIPITGTLSLSSPYHIVTGANIILQRSTDGVTFSDVATTLTNAKGEYTFIRSEAVARTYYYRTIYTGSSTLMKATSKVAKVIVELSQEAYPRLTASTTTPTVNQQVTFTAKLDTWPSGVLAGKPVTIWHTYKGVRYTDVTKTTDAYGKFTFVQKFGSSGVRYYYATFAGDATYAEKTTSFVTIYVGSRVTLTASTTTPTVGLPVTFTATLNNGATPLSGKLVTIYHWLNGVRYTDTTKTTNANGKITLIQTFSSEGYRKYYASFAGDSAYGAATSSALWISPHY